MCNSEEGEEKMICPICKTGKLAVNKWEDNMIICSQCPATWLYLKPSVQIPNIIIKKYHEKKKVEALKIMESLKKEPKFRDEVNKLIEKEKQRQKRLGIDPHQLIGDEKKS